MEKIFISDEKKDLYIDYAVKGISDLALKAKGFSDREITQLRQDPEVQAAIEDQKAKIIEDKHKKKMLTNAKKMAELEFIVENQELFYKTVLEIIRDDRKEAIGAKAGLVKAFLAGQIAYLTAYGRNQAAKDQEMNKSNSDSGVSSQEFRDEVTPYSG